MFPGIVSLIVGVIVLAVWIISFFVAISFYASTAVLLIALMFMIAGIVQIFHGLSGLREMRSHKNCGKTPYRDY